MDIERAVPREIAQQLHAGFRWQRMRMRMRMGCRRWLRLTAALGATFAFAACAESTSSEGSDDGGPLLVMGYWLLRVVLWLVAIAFAFVVVFALVLGVFPGATRVVQWAWSGSRRT